mmetsp:Transcript_19458/g.77636  ORF Transcript_19458/g.77636 Transcript_19458/m.77636 type:complete len:318 (-) Transcript_19458:1014-1967(-)
MRSEVPQRRMSERLAVKSGSERREDSSVQTFSTKKKVVKKKPLSKVDSNISAGRDLPDVQQADAANSKKRRFSFYENEERKDLESTRRREAQLREEMAVLQTKYDKLKELRFSDVENIYQQYKQSVTERSTAADELLTRYKDEADRLRTLTQKSKEVNAYKDVEIYRRENATLKTELLEIKTQLVEVELKALEMQESSNDKLEAPKRAPEEKVKEITTIEISSGSPSSESIIRILQILTGAVVNQTAPNAFTFLVVNAERQRQMRFQLTVSGEDVEYEPIETENLTELPSYMRDSIIFDFAEAPMFCSKVISVVFSR